ncbi:MAG TPA: DUF6644 family protein [Lunatimonas sp.]|nr:DUF6644 family protein [Lunatimonas sp.]
MLESLEWLENSSMAMAVRQSLWAYPALEVIHILGIVLMVGAAFMFDLRLLGFSRKLHVGVLARHILPWSQRGLFLLIIPSGFLLFITNAKSLGTDTTFWLKMGLLLLGGLNVLIFHRFFFPSTRFSEAGKAFPFRVKVSATISLIVWTAVIACGRWLAY